MDFVFVDWSNNTFYEPDVKYVWAMDMIESSTDLLFEIWSEIPNAPKICIMVGPGHMLGRDNPIAVSYTHLDVYKRQRQDTAESEISLTQAFPESKQQLFMNTLAVSAQKMKLTA